MRSASCRRCTSIAGAADRRKGAARLGIPAPVAQGIERCPAEAEVACSNHAGRMAQPSGFGGVDAPKKERISSMSSACRACQDHSRACREREARAYWDRLTVEQEAWALR